MFESTRADAGEIRLLQAAAAWGTLATLLLSALALGANRPVSWTFMAMFVAVFFTAQLLHDLLRPPPAAARQVWLPAALYLAVLLWAVVQTLSAPGPGLAHPLWETAGAGPPRISGDPIAGRQIIMRLIAYGMVFWIMLRAAANPNRAWALLGAVALFSTALAGFGIYAVMAGSNPILGEDAGAVVSASFVNRNSYATYAVFGGLANLALYLRITGETDTASSLREFLERFFGGAWIFGLGTLISFAAVVMTQSRAGSAAGIVGLVTFFALLRPARRGMNLALVATLAATLGFVALTLTSGVTKRLMTAGGEDERFTIYPRIVEAIGDRPLLGNGLGSFLDAFRPYVPLESASAEWAYAHSTYLENAFEMGLPAAGLFYLALVLIAWRIFRGARERRRDRLIPILAAAAVAAGAFHSAFDFSLQMPATAALFAALLGIAWAQSFRSEPRSRSRSRRARTPHRRVEPTF